MEKAELEELRKALMDAAVREERLRGELRASARETELQALGVSTGMLPTSSDCGAAAASQSPAMTRIQAATTAEGGRAARRPSTAARTSLAEVGCGVQAATRLQSAKGGSAAARRPSTAARTSLTEVGHCSC